MHIAQKHSDSVRRTYRRSFMAITAVLSARRHARGRQVRPSDDRSSPRVRPVGRSRRSPDRSSRPARATSRSRRVASEPYLWIGSASMSVVRAMCIRVPLASLPSSALLVRRAETKHLRRHGTGARRGNTVPYRSIDAARGERPYIRVRVTPLDRMSRASTRRVVVRATTTHGRTQGTAAS